MTEKNTNEEFSAGRLRSHGSYEIRRKSELFVIEAEGPFNLESVLAIGQTRLAALDAWGTGAAQAWLVIFHTSMLMSLDALNAFSMNLQKQLPVLNSLVAPQIHQKHRSDARDRPLPMLRSADATLATISR